jgi:hypothetical protein
LRPRDLPQVERGAPSPRVRGLDALAGHWSNGKDTPARRRVRRPGTARPPAPPWPGRGCPAAASGTSLARCPIPSPDCGFPTCIRAQAPNTLKQINEKRTRQTTWWNCFRRFREDRPHVFAPWHGSARRVSVAEPGPRRGRYGRAPSNQRVTDAALFLSGPCRLDLGITQVGTADGSRHRRDGGRAIRSRR